MLQVTGYKSTMTKNNIKKIKKRDGRIVDFDQQKITDAIYKAVRVIGEENGELSGRLSDRVVEILNERFIGGIPQVEDIQDIVEETLIKEGQVKVAKAFILYRQKRREIREAKYWLLNHEIKTKLTPNAIRVLESRYLRKDDHGKIQETPQEMFQRVASNIAAAEKIYNPEISDDELFKIEEKFYRMMASLDFLPNSPTLMNAGLHLQQLSACFVLPVSDSMEGIFEAVKQGAIIHQSGGGTGYSFSRLRPQGDLVKSTKGIASGPISFMTVFDAATNTVKQGGKRRGANMGILRIDHPDILKFITAKEEEGILSNFNISVAVTDEFMEAVKNGKKYNLINPRNNQIVKELDAREVFDLIVQLAWRNGEPGVIFIDKMNEANPTPKLGKIESTNPCSELPLLPYESCNLGSINLSKMLKETRDGYEIDWEKYKQTIYDAMHFLDNVIDMNRYPLPEIEAMTKGNRKIGLGVMGFADTLIKLGIPYNSERGVRAGEKIMKFLYEESMKKSVELAQKRGVFPNFKDSVYDQPNALKVRNATTTTIAPTGTISIIAGCSSGIEPLFAISYVRKHVLGGEELVEVNPLFEEIAKEEGFYSKELMEEIAEKGSVQDIKEIPEKIKKIFVTAMDIAPEWHVRMQAAFQEYNHNAVSKTINFPFSATIGDVEKSYTLAYDLNCKGITIYRSESRKQQVLNIKGKEERSLIKEEKIEATTVGEKIEEKEISPELRDPSPEIPDLPPGSCPTCIV